MLYSGSQTYERSYLKIKTFIASSDYGDKDF